jgi:hypothetical protein
VVFCCENLINCNKNLDEKMALLKLSGDKNFINCPLPT